jgi:hypothetical protein
VTVPVPDRVRAAYVVLTAAPLDRVDELPLPDEGLLRLRGTSEAVLEQVRARPARMLVSGTYAPADARRETGRLRAEALALADAHDGLVLDLQVPRVVQAQARPGAVTQWFAFDVDPTRPGDVATHGLEAFGLPEVRLVGVDDARRPMYDAVVVGLVSRLLAEWPAHDPVGPAAVTLRDIAEGYAEPGASGTTVERRVALLIDYAEDAHELLVELADDPATTLFA